MAEILASIQRILSENEPEDRSTARAAPRASKPAAAEIPEIKAEPPVPEVPPPPEPQADPHDDVLVLDKNMMVAADGAGSAEPPYKSPLLEAATSRDMAPMTPQPVSHLMPHPFPLPEEPEPANVPESAIVMEPPAPMYDAPHAPPEPPASFHPAPPQPAPLPRPGVHAASFAGGGNGLVAPDTAAVAATAIGNLVRTIAAERVVPVQRGGLTIEDLVREELRPLLKSWLDAHLPPLVEKLVQVEIERVVNRAT